MRHPLEMQGNTVSLRSMAEATGLVSLGASMSNEAQALEYERLAILELEAVSSAPVDKARNVHLDQAAIYAHLSEAIRRAYQ